MVEMKKTNIYPPIVNEWKNAYIIGSNIRIYFTISSYMTIADINPQLVLVSIRNQRTNKSVINEKRNAGLDFAICSIQQDDEGYFIEVRSSIVEVEVNKYYKVQLRFVSSEYSYVSIWDFRKNYNNDTVKPYISDVSKVALIKPISENHFDLAGFKNNSPNSLFVFSTSSVNISGRLVFSNDDDEEKLAEYKVKLFDSGIAANRQATDLIIESETLTPDDSDLNSIFYELKYDFKNENYYLLRIEYVTTSNYSSYEDFLFKIEFQDGLEFAEDAEGSIQNNFVNATIDLQFKGTVQIHKEQEEQDNEETEVTHLKGCCVLRRSSSKDNFVQWEDIQYFSWNEQNYINITYSDYLVEYGVYYKYQLFPQDSNAIRGTSYWFQEQDKATLCEFDYARLVINDSPSAKKNQLTIRFDEKVDNFQVTVVESKTDTLGGKYPFIRRNGDTYYRQFNLSGLISHMWDDDDVEESTAQYIKRIADEEEIGPTTLSKKRDTYVSPFHNKEYYSNNININNYNDFLLERGYREKVIEYLYENCVRLFRSPTEGNILIKLMNISLSPNATLSRMVYSFSATAYEIDTATTSSYIKYGIHSVNQDIVDESLKITVYDTHHLGQIQLGEIEDEYRIEEGNVKSIDIMDAICRTLSEKSQLASIVLDKLTWIRFNLASNPYLLQPNISSLTIDYENILTDSIIREGEQKDNAYWFSGYVGEINGSQIVLPMDGYYELKDDDTDLQSVILYEPAYATEENHFQLKGTVDYIASYKVQGYQTMRTRKSLRRYYIIGQYIVNTNKDMENNGEITKNIIKLIKDKHRITESDNLNNQEYIKREVLTVPYISIEGCPYQELQIADLADQSIVEEGQENVETLTLNGRGQLTLYDEDTAIEVLRFIKMQDDIYSQSYGTIENEDLSKNEKVLDKENSLNDILVNYICYVEEARY